VRADEKLTAFVELESVIRACRELPRQTGEIFPKLAVAKPNGLPVFKPHATAGDAGV
jgi:hypothetical protein